MCFRLTSGAVVVFVAEHMLLYGFTLASFRVHGTCWRRISAAPTRFVVWSYFRFFSLVLMPSCNWGNVGFLLRRRLARSVSAKLNVKAPYDCAPWRYSYESWFSWQASIITGHVMASPVPRECVFTIRFMRAVRPFKIFSECRCEFIAHIGIKDHTIGERQPQRCLMAT